ncbi:hypothetical protein [Streptomyces sp. NPDC047718]|uniref:hypothetical protein n=1 Tax=Streptomyces sp. NPDC047718 TaxID=3155479 RepID=UPI0033D2B414
MTVSDPSERYVAEADAPGVHHASEFRLDGRSPGRTVVRVTFSTAPAASGRRPGLFMRLPNRLGARAVAKAVTKDLAEWRPGSNMMRARAGTEPRRAGEGGSQ